MFIIRAPSATTAAANGWSRFSPGLENGAVRVADYLGVSANRHESQVFECPLSVQEVETAVAACSPKPSSRDSRSWRKALEILPALLREGQRTGLSKRLTVENSPSLCRRTLHALGIGDSPSTVEGFGYFPHQPGARRSVNARRGRFTLTPNIGRLASCRPLPHVSGKQAAR